MSASSPTPTWSATMTSRPQLPPRATPSDGRATVYPELGALDGRMSSGLSLTPSIGGTDDSRYMRGRTLLLVYIHGFMGNDSSFHSFPAHVHEYLRLSLDETHSVHSKIYPRYKTYKSIDVAKDNFSSWLQPHESSTTDVVLLGHSMGGLLAADVALMPSRDPENGFPFRHRILGTISLDAPLLGLHPGIIVSGLASLFSPAPEPTRENTTDLAANSPSLSPLPSPLSGSSSADPSFNPPFFNDVQFKDRGWFQNVMHFAAKHRSENLIEAAASHIMSHLEFGGCLADYSGLNSRYHRLRALEDVDDLNVRPGQASRPARIRFANYYTVCSGKPKQPKQPKVPPSSSSAKSLASRQQSYDQPSPEITASASTPDIPPSRSRSPSLQEMDPIPLPDDPEEAISSEPQHEIEEPQRTIEETRRPAVDLPPLPELPERPEAPDLDAYTDKAARKQAEKEAARAQKVYEQAVKSREKAVRERAKLAAKQLKDAERREREQEKAAAKREKKDGKQAGEERRRLHKEVCALQDQVEEELQLHDQKYEQQLQKQRGEDKQAPQKRERNFCMLPGKVSGVRDPAWVRVYMEGVDEVGAHCGLFLPGPHYEKLVGDIGSRIVGWVHEDVSRRAILDVD